MNEVTRIVRPAGGLRNIAIFYFAIMIAVFMAGFLPMWLRARANAHEVEAANQKLRYTELQTLLANAAIDSRRGDYEPARQAASDFFTRVAGETKDKKDPGLKTNQEKFAAVLAQRDEMITLLARNDPASAERLTTLYILFRDGTISPGSGGKTNELSSTNR